MDEDRHHHTNQVAWDALVAGQRYRVSFQDCCAYGWFEGVFVDQDEDEVRFDCGRYAKWSGQMWITEV